jgi:hypothetical protein
VFRADEIDRDPLDLRLEVLGCDDDADANGIGKTGAVINPHRDAFIYLSIGRPIIEALLQGNEIVDHLA